MDRSELIKWIWFAQSAEPGTYNAAKLLNEECGIDEIYLKEFSRKEYGDIFDTRIIDALNDKNLDGAAVIYNYCEEHNITVVPYTSSLYPPKLRGIQNPPAVLYYKGNIQALSRKVLLGCVGTRNASEYGIDISLSICDGIARSGIIIVSGMARGIDSACAAAALNAGKFTVAVLGCGVDVIYPRENDKLYDSIVKHGLLISEYPPLEEPQRKNFPQRNRIISGISNGVFVIEADVDSGAMITAQDAFFQGRDVFAIPGRPDDRYFGGTNRLIQNGAKLVTCANDIIVEYQYVGETELIPVKKSDAERTKRERRQRKNKQKSSDPPKSSESILLSNEEKNIFNILSETPTASEDIAEAAGITQGQAMALLMILQVKGLASELPGNLFVKNLKG